MILWHYNYHTLLMFKTRISEEIARAYTFEGQTGCFNSTFLSSQVRLDVLSGLPHGFLSLTNMSKDCAKAVDYIAGKLRDIILSM